MGNWIAKAVFQPPPATYGGHAIKLNWRRTKNKREIPCTFIDNNSEYTILFSHGNAEDIGMVVTLLRGWSEKVQVNLLVYDYVGYGVAKRDRVTGEDLIPSEQGCYDAVETCFDFLRNDLKKDTNKIILWGRSLGSGPTCWLGKKCAKENIPLCGIILQSAFQSIFRVAFDFRLSLPGDLFPNIDRIPFVDVPVMVIHGTKDEIVPFFNGERLFFAVPPKLRYEPKWVANGNHNNIEYILGEDDQLAKIFAEFVAYASDNDYQKPTTLFDVNSQRKSSTKKTRKGSWFGR